MIVACSYVYYVVLAIAAKWFGLKLTIFLTIYVLLLAGLAAIALKVRRVKPKPIDQHWLSGLLVVVIGYSLYRFWVGPYTEIPADLYRHLEYARIQFEAIANGQLGPQLGIKAILNQQGGIWYSFYALINALTSLEFSQSFPWATYANGVIFLSVVFSFAWYIFKEFIAEQNQRLWAALLATFFVASHFGLNVLSYLRYYSFAPTMLNMTIYFAAVIAILELLKWRAQQLSFSVFIFFALIASAAVHNQEALYILIMGGMLLAWYALLPKSLAVNINRYFPVNRLWAYRLLLIVFVGGFLALAMWTYVHYDRPNSFFNKVLRLTERGPILDRLLFLNPSYQGIQVITIWGVAVYAIFIVYWKQYIRQPYLFAGMLVPLVTIFNPVFVDWFLRVDGVHTLWRMLYIVPIHFCGAAAVAMLLSSATVSHRWWRKAAAYVSIIGLFVLLLPIPNVNSNSRLTLAPVDKDESYFYWRDLIDFLNQDELVATSILTDPVTGYVLSGLSKHRTYQYKFFSKNSRQFNFPHYDDAPLKKYAGWLLVVNDRNGGDSETGEISRHWPKHILKTADFYSDALRAHIIKNPEQRFELLWERDNIYVYKIH